MVTRIDPIKIKEQAEKHYADGDYFCSEAIVSTIRDHFQADMPLSAIAMASGFPVGIGGSKCVCGAVSGGVMCLGFFFGRTAPKDERVDKAMALAAELHDSFKKDHKVLCCKILTKKLELGSEDHMRQCISFTGEVAEKTARIIARELNISMENQKVGGLEAPPVVYNTNWNRYPAKMAIPRMTTRKATTI